jgi:uncharacterized protein (DUF58 family)
VNPPAPPSRRRFSGPTGLAGMTSLAGLAGMIMAPISGWRHRITPGGRWLVAAAALAGAGTTVSVLIPFYQIFCALAAVLAVVEIAGVLCRPRLVASASLPDRTSLGQDVTGEVTLSNRSRRTAWDIATRLLHLPNGLKATPLSDQPGHGGTSLATLPPGESIGLPFSLQPLRRGLYAVPPLQVETTFPFNLVRTTITSVDLGRLLVVPSFHPLTSIHLPVAHRYQPGGIAMTSRVGESPEYIGNREYLPGEPARRLDFRSWARLGRPVVREFQEEYFGRVALVLDTHIKVPRIADLARRRPGQRLTWGRHKDGRRFLETVAAEGHPQLEAAISLTAAAADALCGGEHVIDLFAAGPELYVFRSGRHTAHFDNVLEILACLDPCRRDPFEQLAPAILDELASLSSAVLVLLDWDDSRRRLARAVIEAGCSLKVLIVRDTPTTQPFEEDGLPDVTCWTPEDIRQGVVEMI